MAEDTHDWSQVIGCTVTVTHGPGHAWTTTGTLTAVMPDCLEITGPDIGYLYIRVASIGSVAIGSVAIG